MDSVLLTAAKLPGKDQCQYVAIDSDDKVCGKGNTMREAVDEARKNGCAEPLIIDLDIMEPHTYVF